MEALKEKKFVIAKDTKYKGTLNQQADRAMRELDRVLRWKKVHALLRTNNKKARKEQDITAADAKFFRDNKLIKNTKSKTMGLRLGVALPPMTYTMIIQADRLVNGKSDLAEPDKEDSRLGITATNQLVKDLEKAFPQYKVSK